MLIEMEFGKYSKMCVLTIERYQIKSDKKKSS